MKNKLKTSLSFFSILTITPLLVVSCGAQNTEQHKDLTKLENWQGAAPSVSSTIFPKLTSFDSFENAYPFVLTTKAIRHLFKNNYLNFTFEDDNSKVVDVILDKDDPYLQSIFFVIEKNSKTYKYHSKNLSNNKNFKFGAYKALEKDSSLIDVFGVNTKDWNSESDIGFKADNSLLRSYLQISYFHIDHEHKAGDDILNIPLRVMIYDEIDKPFAKNQENVSSSFVRNNKYMQERIGIYLDLYALRYLFGTREEFLSSNSFNHFKLTVLGGAANPDLDGSIIDNQNDIGIVVDFYNEKNERIYKWTQKDGILKISWLFRKK